MSIGTILVSGKSGQVGWELQRTLASLGDVIAIGQSDLDLADPEAIRLAIRKIKPALIVNAAAYTAVDKAESELDHAMAINGIAPGILAQEARRLNGAFIHYSTDYVFDGTKATPYTEEDKPNPVSVYGKTKLAGEQAIEQVGGRYLILRTSWVYGARGRNFLLTILRLAAQRNELKIVADQHGAPTWSRAIAEATAQIIARLYTPARLGTAALDKLSGIYHLTAAGHTTWHGFAKAFLEHPSLRSEHRSPSLLPITTQEYPTAAARPKNSRLNSARLRENFGIEMPDWEQSLGLCLEEILPQGKGAA